MSGTCVEDIQAFQLTKRELRHTEKRFGSLKTLCGAEKGAGSEGLAPGTQAG